MCFIPTIKFDDQWVEYFDESVKFRSDSDVVLDNFGVYPIEYSIPAKSEGGISEPEYLQNIEKFIVYLREVENVEHVYSISDIMKRLNKNMHGDDQSYYRIPEERDILADDFTEDGLRVVIDEAFCQNHDLSRVHFRKRKYAMHKVLHAVFNQRCKIEKREYHRRQREKEEEELVEEVIVEEDLTLVLKKDSRGRILPVY